MFIILFLLFVICIKLFFIFVLFTLFIYFFFRLRLGNISRLKELVKLFQDLLLRLWNLKLIDIQSDRIRLTAGLLKVILIYIIATSSKSSIHHFLVINHWKPWSSYSICCWPRIFFFAVTVSTSFTRWFRGQMHIRHVDQVPSIHIKLRFQFFSKFFLLLFFSWIRWFVFLLIITLVFFLLVPIFFLTSVARLITILFGLIMLTLLIALGLLLIFVYGFVLWDRWHLVLVLFLVIRSSFHFNRIQTLNYNMICQRSHANNQFYFGFF